jgi:hypothetical protein
VSRIRLRKRFIKKLTPDPGSADPFPQVFAAREASLPFRLCPTPRSPVDVTRRSILRAAIHQHQGNASTGKCVDGKCVDREMRRQDTYCSNFSRTPATLAVGLRRARRAMGLPSNRSRPVTNSAVPSGRPLPSAGAVAQLLVVPKSSRGVVFLERKPRKTFRFPGFPARGTNRGQ